MCDALRRARPEPHTRGDGRSSMARRRIHVAVAAALVLGLAGASIAFARGNDGHNGRDNQGAQLRAHLISYNEVPSLNSPGHAEFSATMTPDKIDFTLTFGDLTG